MDGGNPLVDGISSSVSIPSLLQRHALFQRHGSPSPGPIPRNVLALDGNSRIFYCDENSHLHVFPANMKPVDGSHIAHSTLRCEPDKLDFNVCELLFNSNCSLLCIIGEHKCVVVQITKRVLRDLTSLHHAEEVGMAPHDIHARSTAIGRAFYHTKKRRILKAHWHPASDSHLAILSSDGILCLYNVSDDVDEPEQRYALRDLLPHSPSSSSSGRRAGNDVIDFTFASPRSFRASAAESATWNLFTAYLLTGNGRIYALCPMLPYDCAMDASIFSTLLDRVEEGMSIITSGDHNFDPTTSSRLLDRYKSQKTWIMEVQGAALVKERDPNAQGALHTSWISTRRPYSFLSSPVLQGPLDPQPLDDPLSHRMKGKEVPCGIFIVPPGGSSSTPVESEIPVETTLRVLYRTHRSGLLEAFFAFEDHDPMWDLGHFERDVDAKQLVLYERQDLRIPSSVVKHGSFAPVASFDSTRTDRFYVRHGAGVHCVTIPWVSHVYEYARGSPEDGEDAPFPTMLPRSKVECLMDTLPGVGRGGGKDSAPVIGFSAVSLARDRFLMMVTHLRQCICRAMLDDQEEMNRAKLSLPVAGEQGRDDGFTAEIKELETRATRTAHLVPSKRLNYDDPESVQVLLSTCAKLRADYIVPVTRIAAELEQHRDAMEDRMDDQRERLGTLKESLQSQISRSKSLERRLRDILRMQELLNERIGALQEIAALYQPCLSREEEEYFKELANRESTISAYKLKLQSLKEQTHSLSKPRETATLSEAQVKRIVNLAQHEDAMLQETLSAYEKLSSQVDGMEAEMAPRRGKE